MATAYFVKKSVITRMSFVLLESGSNERKSIQTNSRGLETVMLTNGAALSDKALRHTHQLQVFI